MPDRYIQPNWFTRNVFNRFVAWLAQIGISMYGSRVLAVRGRKTGAWHTIPVNLLEHRGQRYLVAPRGITQWVRNVRAGSDVELRLGSRRERVKLDEIPDDDPLKIELLREYLRKWAFEVGVFFDGVGANASADELRRIAPNHPVFRVTSTAGA
jgi:deazaflavin-dependent oxidoreductase (nitroreductase family)